MGMLGDVKRKIGRIALAGGLLGGVLVAGGGLAEQPIVSAAGTPVTEDFTSGYSGGVGWAGNWTEVGDDGSSVTGDIRINSGALRFQNLDGASISRTLDLSGFDQGAVFSYTFVAGFGNEEIVFEFRTGASSFATIAQSADDAPDGTRYSFVLTSAMFRSDAELRIVGADSTWDTDEFVEIDDILIDNPVPNPDLDAACGTDVILILDESGSIAGATGAVANVKSAVTTFVDGLVGTGSRMRITEFSNNGRNAQIGGSTAADEAFRTVDLAFRADVVDYLDGAGDTAQTATSYNPGVGQQFTNWEAGIDSARLPGSPATNGVGAPLVVFFTDGNPNTIGLGGDSPNSNGGGNDNSAAAAYQEMEALRSAGAHVVTVAVGDAFSDADAFTRIEQITEPVPPVEVWDDPTTTLDIRTTDVLKVTNFDALENALREVVFALCAPSVTLNKIDQDGDPVQGWDFDLTVESLSGPAPNDPFEWVSPVSEETTAPSTKTRATDSSGIALFQWTPGSVADPQPWDSTIGFSEDLEPGWQIDPSTYETNNDNCTVKRLAAPDFTVDIVKTSGDPVPGSTVDFKLQDNDAQTTDNDFVVDKADIVSCTIKNIAPVTVRVAKVVDPATDPGLFDLSINGAVKAAGVGDGGGGASTDTEVPVGSAVTVSEAPSGATVGADYGSSLLCPGATLDVNTGTAGEFDAPLSAAGEVITCTFTNTRKTADLTVDKTWVNAIVDDEVSIAIDGINDDGGSSTADTPSETDADVAGTTVYAGETVIIAETFTTGSVTNYTPTLACVYGQQNTALTVTNGSITIPPAAENSTIRCTFTNTRNSATLTLEKAWVNGEAGDQAAIGINGINDNLDVATATGAAGTEVSANTASTTVFAGEIVILSEDLPGSNAAAYQTTLDCGGNSIALTNRSGTYTVPADPENVTCRFTNTADRGTIVIVKNAEGDTGTFDYTGDWADVLPSGSFQITTAGTGTSTGSVTYPGVLAGTYSVAENDPAPVWDLSSLVCSDSFPGGTGSTPNPAAQQLSGEINLDPGETVTCTFTNTKRGSITVVKDVTNTPNGTDPNVFDFGGDLGPFTLADNGVAAANTITFPNLVAGDYTITETDANEFGFSLDSIECGSATTNPVTDGVTVTLGVAEAVTCVFVNKAEGSLTIEKNADSPLFPVDDNTFGVVYDIVVTNTGPGQTTYDLTDTPDFGDGTTITAISVSGPSGALPDLPVTGGTIVTAEPIGPSPTSHTYTVSITFDVAPSMTKTDRTCVTDTAGLGTYNSATITFPGGTDTDNDCVTIPDPTPTITKTVAASQPVAVDGDTFTVDYDIVVTNPGPGQTTYTLSDAPAFGPGTTITSIDVELPGGAALTPALPVTGGTIVTDDPIDGATSETYSIRVTFDVAADMTSIDRRCLTGTPGRGAFNAATIVYPGGTDSDDACATIPEPDITTAKSVVGAPTQPVQVGTGFQYTVDYLVTVTNNGDGLGTYTLVDAPSFGASIDSIELIAPVPASANPTFGLSDLAIVKTAASLAPNETETFNVRATFTVDAVATSGQRDCDPVQGEGGTGTFNSVTVTPNIGDPVSDTACAPIPGPDITVEKDVTAGPSYDSTSDSYSISYGVVVSNNGSGPGTYDLIENPTFGAGTTITEISLDGTPVGPPVVNPLVDDAPIAAGETDNYTVTIVFTVAAETTAEARDCTLLDGENGTGTLNTVTVDPNIGPNDDGSDCGQIPSPGIGVVKTATGDPVQVGNTDEYTVDYTVTVSNTGPAAGTYTLVDAPAFGAGVNPTGIELIAPVPAVANPGFGPGDLTIVGAPGAELLAGASEVFTVRASFVVDPATPAAQRDCELGTDPGTGTFNSATVTPNIGEPSSDDDCRPVPEPDISVEKTATAGPTYDSAAGTYSISYDVVVTNAGGPGTYSVSESPTFGGGATITSVTLDGAPVALPIVNPVAADLPIGAGGTVTHVVVIEFTVDGSTPPSARDCVVDPGEGGTGTLNTVTVTPNIGEPDEGSDCEPLGDPDIQITKTLSDGPAQTAPGSSTWTATYTLQVDNLGEFGGSYDLTDSPGFATGLTITGQSATSADLAINGDFNDAVGNSTIATGVAIAPGETDVVTVVVTFDYTGQVDPVDRVCGADPGLGDATYNSATVTPNIGPASTDDDCAPVPGPDVSVDKTISSGPTDNLDGTFTIVYEIDVTNAADAGTADYDLSDAASFSPGVTIQSQSVANTAPGSIATDATFPTSGNIVAGETILAGQTHTYEVTVVATLAVDETTTYEECSSTTGAAGEGLFNRASLTVDGETVNDDVCGDIPGDLQIEKSDGGIELTEGDVTPFEYQLTVMNVGGASTGDSVTVTDVLPDEFLWFDFPDTAGDFPFCTVAGQVLTCDIDPSLVDAGGESTSFIVSAQLRDDTEPSVDGYENLSYVDSPGDPAPATPVCEPQAISSASGIDALIVGFATPTNNVACDRTPVNPAEVEPIPPPTTTTPPPVPTPTTPPEGLPRTGSDSPMNTLGLAALLLGLGVGLTLVVRRRHRSA